MYTKENVEACIHFVARASQSLFNNLGDVQSSLNAIPEELQSACVAAALAAKTCRELTDTKATSALDDLMKDIFKG